MTQTQQSQQATNLPDDFQIDLVSAGTRNKESTERSPAPIRKPGETKRTAFLVIHGMGQQVPYETVSALGKAILTQHQLSTPGVQLPVPKVARVTLDGQAQTSRVEISFDKDGFTHEGHLYEAYWAPLTEGQIGLWGVVSFLYEAAFRGLKALFVHRARRAKRVPAPGQSAGSFARFVFKRSYEMGIKRNTYPALFAVVVLITAALVPVVVAFVPSLRSVVWKWFSGLVVGHKPPLPLWERSLAIAGALTIALLAVLLRYVLIEYVGDIVIYISAYKVSRYQTVREAISQIADTAAAQIYGYRDANKQLYYDNVVIVGHSLGSIIAYDTLNDMINYDAICKGGALQVVARTTRLITFGSPLDKTAFIFRTQVLGQELREALAALQQPLIQEYALFRPKHFSWINIYSPADIISGSLEYYDIPPYADDPNRIIVDNKPDPQANIPLLAHVQYWNNKLLHKILYESF